MNNICIHEQLKPSVVEVLEGVLLLRESIKQHFPLGGGSAPPPQSFGAKRPNYLWPFFIVRQTPGGWHPPYRVECCFIDSLNSNGGARPGYPKNCLQIGRHCGCYVCCVEGPLEAGALDVFNGDELEVKTHCNTAKPRSLRRVTLRLWTLGYVIM